MEPVERAANRTAAQIDLALRQVNADRASYLRNTDRPRPRTDGAYNTGNDYGNGDGNGKGGNEQKRRTGEGGERGGVVGVRGRAPVVHPVLLVLDNVRYSHCLTTHAHYSRSLLTTHYSLLAHIIAIPPCHVTPSRPFNHLPLNRPHTVHVIM